MIELLAPAGDLEKLKIAYLYGADACYIGGTEFSLRSRASNFTLSEIKEAVLFAHSLGKKLYVTTNIIPHEGDLSGLIEYLKTLDSYRVDAIIAASPVIIETAKKHTNLEVHVSTQTSITNSEAVNFYKSINAARVVLARELTLEEIKKIRDKTDLELEVFIHGGMCMSYSGKCVLSNHMTNRDANRGGCAHSCRWNYYLDSNNNSMPFSMSSKDLMAVKSIKDLISIGVNSLKIEGRMKSLHYIATVTKVYRNLIDAYVNNETIDLDHYTKEILKAENRVTFDGYFFGVPSNDGGLYNERSERPTQIFLGIVLAYDSETSVVTITQRNNFKPFSKIEFFSPNQNNITHTISEIYDENLEILDVARHPNQIIKFHIPFPVSKYTLIRRCLDE